MGVNKVEFGGETLVDLTSDTVNEQSLLSGYTAHNRAGELIEGLAVIPTKLSQLENDAGYAKTESPAFTGTPTAPTPPDNTNDAQIATTAYVKKLIANLVNGAPETLDTLKEIADALGENDDAVQALNAAIGNKVDKVAGKGLSTNDFTTAEKNKLAGIANNANNYSLPLSSTTVRGGAKVGYAENGKNYPVELSNEQMYVNVPWTDNNTWKANTASSEGYVAKGSGQANKVWKTDANGVPGWRADANTTYGAATQSANGLMTAEDKKKLDGIATGANKTEIANNYLVNVPGKAAADAVLAKELRDDFNTLSGNLSNIFTFSGTYNASTGGFNVTVAHDLDPGTYLVAVRLQGTCNNGAGHIAVTLGNMRSSAYAESSFNPEAQVSNIIKVPASGQITVSGYCNIAQQSKGWNCTCIKLSDA